MVGCGSGSAAPTGNIGFGDLSELDDFSDLFQITPTNSDLDGVQLAGDPPAGDSPQEPSDEPPEIPAERPTAGGEAMRFVRKAAAWIRLAGRYSPGASSFLAALEEAQHLKGLTDAIKAATDPPRGLEELQERATLPNEDGYHNHHIAEKKAARDAGDPEGLIESRNNLARIPALQHIEITRYYATKIEREDGSRTSPRESLKDADFETRWQYGIDVLRRYGVLK